MSTSSAPVHVCVACNPCCDGALFSRLEVTPEEQEKLRERGSFYAKEQGQLRTRLGCSYLGGDGACQCHDDRPKICRNYRCDLLRSVDAGITTLEHAVAIVGEARALRDKSIAASRAAILAGNGAVTGEAAVDTLMERVEQLLELSAPILPPAVAVAQYRYPNTLSPKARSRKNRWCSMAPGGSMRRATTATKTMKPARVVRPRG
ncbi:MAG: YkgJ family cysteine cluster protein [Betaproteobacteria bacterium]